MKTLCLNINQHWAATLPLLSVDFSKICRIGLISSSAFFMPKNSQNIYIGASQPKCTKLDFIEAKTTIGGEQISSSMIQIPLFHQLASVCNAKSATYDLTQLWDNAAKLNNRSVIDTFEMNVKGLIELMCQI